MSLDRMENCGQGSGNAKRAFICCTAQLAVASILLAISCSVGAVEGVQHQVGGTPGWSLPTFANVNYTVWASTQTFRVGDTLYFNYSSARHNVLEVTASKYDECNATDPIATWDDGATIIPLNTTGTFYYICGITGHCAQGQKVAVTVKTSEAAADTAAPTPSPAPGSSARSLYRQYSICPLVLALSLAIVLALP